MGGGGGGGGGRRGKSRTQRRHFSQSRENTWKRPRPDVPDSNAADGNSDSNAAAGNSTGWQPFATHNPAFDEYYKEQAIVSPEEWDTFIE